MQRRRMRQLRRLLDRDDATKADFTGMGRCHISADVPPGCGMHAIGAGDHARQDVFAVLKVQAYPGRLLG